MDFGTFLAGALISGAAAGLVGSGVGLGASAIHRARSSHRTAAQQGYEQNQAANYYNQPPYQGSGYYNDPRSGYYGSRRSYGYYY